MSNQPINLTPKDFKRLKIVIPQNASYEEVSDSISDLLKAGIIIEQELGDGFQFQDLFAFLQAQPLVNEIIQDVPIFMDEFLKLNGETAKAAVIEAFQRVRDSGMEFGKITGFLINFLYVAGSNYGFVQDVYQKGQLQILLWQNLISGNPVIPGFGVK